MNKMRILMMFSGEIVMEKNKDHDAIRGLSVEYYLFGDNGELVQSKVSADGVSGTRRGKSFMPLELSSKVSFVPGIYDGTFEMSVGSDGKPVLRLVDFDYVCKALISSQPEEKTK